MKFCIPFPFGRQVSSSLGESQVGKKGWEKGREYRREGEGSKEKGREEARAGGRE